MVVLIVLFLGVNTFCAVSAVHVCMFSDSLVSLCN